MAKRRRYGPFSKLARTWKGMDAWQKRVLKEKHIKKDEILDSSMIGGGYAETGHISLKPNSRRPQKEHEAHHFRQRLMNLTAKERQKFINTLREHEKERIITGIRFGRKKKSTFKKRVIRT